jgi:hypothetical protein
MKIIRDRPEPTKRKAMTPARRLRVFNAADGYSSNEGADIECPACDGSGKIVEAATTTGDGLSLLWRR